jgi:hypothetical protein
MKNSGKLWLILLSVVSIALAGCQHKLVAQGDQHSVKVFPGESTYEKVKDMKKQGGPAGMLAGLGENFMAKEVDNNTPVRIVSSDSEGAQIEVTDGPNKGMQGFVPKENVN